MELFDYIGDVGYEKRDVFKTMQQWEEKKYPGYLINKYFSFLPDTIFFANEMNFRSHLDNKMKHHFYLHGLRKKKRFTKWIKPEDVENLEFIKQVYDCSNRKAKEYLSILTPTQIESLKETFRHIITLKKP